MNITNILYNYGGLIRIGLLGVSVLFFMIAIINILRAITNTQKRDEKLKISKFIKAMIVIAIIAYAISRIIGNINYVLE